MREVSGPIGLKYIEGNPINGGRSFVTYQKATSVHRSDQHAVGCAGLHVTWFFPLRYANLKRGD